MLLGGGGGGGGGHGSSETSIKTTWHTRPRAGPWVLDGNWFRIYSWWRLKPSRSGWDLDFFSFLLFPLGSRRSGELLYPVKFVRVRRPRSVSLFSFFFIFLSFLSFPFFLFFFSWRRRRTSKVAAGRQAGRQASRQAGRQAGRKTHTWPFPSRTIYFEIFIPFYDEIYHDGCRGMRKGKIFSYLLVHFWW